MFTAELGETVIGADEEIVAADVVIVVIRRTVGWNLGIMVLVFFAKLEITAGILCWNNIKSSFLSQNED